MKLSRIAVASLLMSSLFVIVGCGTPEVEETVSTSSANTDTETDIDPNVPEHEVGEEEAGGTQTLSFAQMKPVKIYSEPFTAWGECTGDYSSNFEPEIDYTNSSSSSSAGFAQGGGSSQSSSVAVSPPSIGGSRGGDVPTDVTEQEPEPDISDDATEFYFSYDESESTAARDLSLAAILNGGSVDQDWGRPYEFLNAEHFGHFNARNMGPFSVSVGLYQSANGAVPVGPDYETDLYTFGISVNGPVLTQEQRRNVVLTLLVDVSGSMGSSYSRSSTFKQAPISLLDVTQHGIYKLLQSLKEGDVVNLVTFDTNAEVALTGWQYEQQNCGLVDAVSTLYTRGSTNLNEGIEFAYQVAQQTFDPDKANRVVMLTDAFANTGEVEPSVIAEHTVINGLEGIYFSGVGIGEGFNDQFLNELTDIGKGTYSAMVSPNDAERIMTEGFTRFIDYAVENVRFKLTYPQSLDQLESAAEEISTVESEVSKIHFSYNSDQFFLESFKGSAAGEDDITFTIYYDGEDGAPVEVSQTYSVEDIVGQGADNIRSALTVAKLAQVIGGELTCTELLDSELLMVPANSDIYDVYSSALRQYCNAEPGGAVTSDLEF